ncbi:MAG: preprotein translocase subunit SecA [Oscillospiraceae bacterium]|jgi:preprotein translocase subunit SecA|nr:preprotein translocase subunit SecA [Oscillospiraceae bacterium]
MSFLNKLFGNYSKRELKRIQPLCDSVLALEDQYRAMSETELKSQTNALKQKLENGATEDDILPEAFAVCREAADRVLGLRHFPVQIIGGIVLHQGRIAEMKTGEGKTLVETLPGYLNALSGQGVHIVTANDYLAKRDSELMGKVYRFLGLTVGLIVPHMENAARAEAYLADITYATNNELGFDYLRDNMVAYKNQKVQRGHHYAIVDEVDSILIDEARTPLIISGPGDKSTDLYTIADNFVKTLKIMKIAEIDTKEDNEELFGNADYVVDEKAKTATLTQNGVKRAEDYFKLENLTDPANVTIQHHINQALKAHGVMKKDIEYVIRDDGVVIVDEFTGRLMFGRRYNDGLHQAIEAKEGVKIERESKTLATITFQNYFRLYKKLSGMTGTAMTEEPEFREIYKLDIIEIPTNKPLLRKDFPDAIFKTENGKFISVIRDIEECHKKGQPVLVGTVSIEKSEVLSKLLSKSGIKHAVLNAKYHEKEAEIIAQAGKQNAVTIATNMAGRGTDISLGGNAEYLAKSEMRRMQISEELISEASGFAETDNEEIINARKLYTDLIAKHKKITQAEAEKVREAGGLYIMGTERHESRRIDNQLRGRSGRQGDPGSSKFYLSTEDSLMRLFGGERMKKYMNILHVEEDEALEDKMLSRSIETAQRAVEGRNFQARKSVLQYDDVLNKQRELIYAQRDKVLNGENLRDQMMVMFEQTVEQIVKRYLPGEDYQDHWDLKGLRNYFMGWLIKEDDLQFSQKELESLSPDYLIKETIGIAKKLYEEREQALSPMLMREIERAILLRCVDTKWMNHIDAMEELKQGIRLRAYGQKDPVVEYRMEGFDMFDEMIASIREDTTRLLLTVKVVQEAPPPPRTDIPNPQNLTTSGGSETNTSKTIKSGQKPGRNDLCTCGSGKKYKRCCGQDN